MLQNSRLSKYVESIDNSVHVVSTLKLGKWCGDESPHQVLAIVQVVGEEIVVDQVVPDEFGKKVA